MRGFIGDFRVNVNEIVVIQVLPSQRDSFGQVLVGGHLCRPLDDSPFRCISPNREAQGPTQSSGHAGRSERETWGTAFSRPERWVTMALASGSRRSARSRLTGCSGKPLP